MTTASDFRAKASAAEAERSASWERSDTDGFVSQAAECDRETKRWESVLEALTV